MIGMFAISLAGHDKNQMYVIIERDGEYVYLADGRLRPIEKPKKKKQKHIQLIKTGLDEDLMKKLSDKQIVFNEDIRRALKHRTNKEVTHV